jgi:ABC-type proline/glycine betaine transport system ATPase subunit
MEYGASIMLITNGKIITWGQPNQILEGHAIYIKDNRIAETVSYTHLTLPTN